MPKEPEPKPTNVRVAYFRAGPNVTKEIETWAHEKGVRVLSVVPVYWEGLSDA